MEEKIKPVGNPPKGWHLRERFIDDENNLFCRAIFVRKLTPEEIIKEEERKAQEPEIKAPETKEPEPQVKPADDGKVMIDKSLLEALMKRIDSIESKTVVGKSSGLNKGELSELITLVKSDGVNERVFDTEELDPDDIIEQGVIFTSYGTAFIITDDRKFGKTVKIPGGRPYIKFKHAATKINKRSYNEDEVTTFCTYISYSKKEIEFLRQHTLMDISFYENNPKQAMSQGAKFIQLASNIHNQISSLDKMKLINKAKQLGINPNQEIRVLRSEIAAHVAESMVTQDIEKANKKINEQVEQLTFLK